MKDQYVADVNDFLKYALLRSLASAGLKVYAAWMLTPADGRSDGGRVGYLSRPELYRDVDAQLFDELRGLVELGSRSVAAIEERGFLALEGSTCQVVRDDATSRRAYIDEVITGSRGADLVFFDPDNGLEVTSIGFGQRSSSKYLLWDELARTYASGHSVVVYQHFPRRPRQSFLADLATRIRGATAWPQLRAVTTSHVAFILVSRTEHAQGVDAALRDLAMRAGSHVMVTSLDSVAIVGKRMRP